MDQKRWEATTCFTNLRSWVSHLFNLTKLLITLLLSLSFVILFIFHILIVGCRKKEKGPINIENLIFFREKNSSLHCPHSGHRLHVSCNCILRSVNLHYLHLFFLHQNICFLSHLYIWHSRRTKSQLRRANKWCNPNVEEFSMCYRSHEEERVTGESRGGGLFACWWQAP